MLSGERMETGETGTDECAVLVALRRKLKVPQALVEKRAKIDHSRFSKWECGYVELSEIELLKVEQCLTDYLASWRTALAELDVARA